MRMPWGRLTVPVSSLRAVETDRDDWKERAISREAEVRNLRADRDRYKDAVVEAHQLAVRIENAMIAALHPGQQP